MRFGVIEPVSEEKGVEQILTLTERFASATVETIPVLLQQCLTLTGTPSDDIDLVMSDAFIQD